MMRLAAMPRSKGFTLIELMVTVSIAAILMLTAVPSLTAFRRNAELTSVANKFITSLNAARGEAMKRGMSAVVVPLDNGASWDAGWAVFVDKLRTRTYSPTGTGTVSTQQRVPAGITVSGNGTAAPATPYVMFDASGFSKNASGGPSALALSIRRNDVTAADQPSQTRIVIISMTGRVRVCTPTSASDTGCNASSTE